MLCAAHSRVQAEAVAVGAQVLLEVLLPGCRFTFNSGIPTFGDALAGLWGEFDAENPAAPEF